MLFAMVAVVFAAGAFVQTIAGFGSALIVMPVLTYFIGIQTSATVLAVAGAAVTVAVLYQNRSGFRWREAGRLLMGSVVGIPVGTIALKALPAAPVIACLGLMLLAYGVFAIFQEKVCFVVPGTDGAPGAATRKDRIVSALVGFCAGLFGGAYATDGPPLVVYGAVKGWPKESFRSILQACFFVDGFLIIACHGASGLVTREVFVYCLYAVPGMLAGLILGTALDRHIDHARFHRMLLGLIIALGLALLARAWFMTMG
jgi:hypothetical protein